MEQQIAVVTALVALGNSLFDFASKMKKDDFSKKVSEWNKELLQAQMLITELITKNAALKQENMKLKVKRREDINPPFQFLRAEFTLIPTGYAFVPDVMTGKQKTAFTLCTRARM